MLSEVAERLAKWRSFPFHPSDLVTQRVQASLERCHSAVDSPFWVAALSI